MLLGNAFAFGLVPCLWTASLAVTNLSHKKWEKQTKGYCCNAHIPTQLASFYHFTFSREINRLFRFTHTFTHVWT